MRVYAKHEKIQEFLKNTPIDGIDIVDDPRLANYLITGRYTQVHYNLNLKGVIIPYTGHNGIDLKAMRDQNLQLFITPTRSKYVAEKAVSLTLALLGKTVLYHNELSTGNWSDRNSDSRVPWVSLQGKSVGLFGFGRIGSKIHQMLKGFDVECYTIKRDRTYPEDVFTVKNLTNLIQMCDIIIISTPLNHETEGIFNTQLFSRMKNKYLINVGRGKIVDEDALYQALQNHTLKGYASDVWYQYPKDKEQMYPSKYPLHEMDNVVLSNHSGGYTETTNQEVNEDLIKLLCKLRDQNTEDALDIQNLI